MQATDKIIQKRKLEKIIYVAWELSDSWSGPESYGCSLHSSMEKYDAYQRQFSKRQQNAYRRSGGVVPETYDRFAGEPVAAYATKKLYRRICGARNGLRVHEWEEKKLIKEKELLYGKTRFGEQKLISFDELILQLREYCAKMLEKSRQKR